MYADCVRGGEKMEDIDDLIFGRAGADSPEKSER